MPEKTKTGIIAFLDGKKTYIVAILFGVFNVGVALGWWTADSTVIQAINVVLGSFGFGFMRAGIKKSK